LTGASRQTTAVVDVAHLARAARAAALTISAGHAAAHSALTCAAAHARARAGARVTDSANAEPGSAKAAAAIRREAARFTGLTASVACLALRAAYQAGAAAVSAVAARSVAGAAPLGFAAGVAAVARIDAGPRVRLARRWTALLGVVADELELRLVAAVGARRAAIGDLATRAHPVQTLGPGTAIRVPARHCAPSTPHEAWHVPLRQPRPSQQSAPVSQRSPSALQRGGPQLPTDPSQPLEQHSPSEVQRSPSLRQPWRTRPERRHPRCSIPNPLHTARPTPSNCRCRRRRDRSSSRALPCMARARWRTSTAPDARCRSCTQRPRSAPAGSARPDQPNRSRETRHPPFIARSCPFTVGWMLTHAATRQPSAPALVLRCSHTTAYWSHPVAIGVRSFSVARRDFLTNNVAFRFGLASKRA
jgi:hypothetical protein